MPYPCVVWLLLSRQRRIALSVILFLILASVYALALIGCTLHETSTVWPAPRPLGAHGSATLPALQPPDSLTTTAPVVEPLSSLALPEALSLALQHNPTLAASGWEVRAGEARTLQAGLLPNPAVTLEIEDFAGSGGLRGVKATEVTLTLNQEVRLAGKRQKQTREVALERDLAAWEYETARLAIITQVRQAFLDVLNIQERLRLHQELVHLAEQVAVTAEARVRAGKVSPIEATRARVALSQERIMQSRTQQLLTGARTRLAATWGSSHATFTHVVGRLDTVTPLPAFEQILQHLVDNPDIARWTTAMAQRQAAVELEVARQLPDPTLAGGVRYANDSGNAALVVGFSMPLPVFDRNQGNLQEARYRLARAMEERQAAHSTAVAALGDAYATLAAALAEHQRLREEVLPGAEQVFVATQSGYQQGKFTLLEVLDAQRTLFEARSQSLDALAAYQQAIAAVERLIGTPLATLTHSPR